jgi:glucokinase
MLIGLDIGGTNLKGVRVTSAGIVEDSLTVPAGGRIAREALLDAVATTVAKLAAGSPPGGVGIAVGGFLQADGMMRRGSTNLSNLVDLPLAATFSDLFGVSCRIEHDGRAAMRGEAWIGAARGLRSAMIVTLGTGIGAGLLLDGRIHSGTHLASGEIGLWRLNPPPDAGEWLTLEEVAAPGRMALRRGVDFASLFADWQQGDRGTGVDRIIELIGRAIANAHLLLDLEMVVLSGAAVVLGEPFRRAIEASFLDACPENFRHGLQIRFAGLGPLAGAIGAAALFREEVRA